jgi:hypothetical protein
MSEARTDPISALDALWRAKLTVSAPTGPLGLPATATATAEADAVQGRGRPDRRPGR